MATPSGDHQHPKNKHPYRFYWLTGGLATLLAAIIAFVATRPSPGPGSSNPSHGPTNSSSGSGGSPSDSGKPPPASNSPTNNGLLASADMEKSLGSFWTADAANPQSLRFSCFPLPDNPSRSAAVELSQDLGAKLYEVVDFFPSSADAAQAYSKFTSTTNNCSWQNTSQGNTSQFTAVTDTNAQSLDSASSLWDVQGAPVGPLNVAPSHDGAMCAVRSGNIDAFLQVIVDSSNSPSMTVLENTIEPLLANKL